MNQVSGYSFASAVEAQHFLIAKIVEEASFEGKPLSSQEQTLLFALEEDKQGEQSVSEDLPEFEDRIRELLRAAFRRDRRFGDAVVLAKYADAIRVLDERDDFLAVVAAPALQGLNPLTAIVSLGALILLISLTAFLWSLWSRHLG